MDLIICFIDDSDFEHDLVKNEIAPSSPELTFVQAYTFDQARKLLGQRTPVLFLLDLWGQDPVVKNPERFLGMHFFNPVNRMKLVEVIFGKKTTAANVDLLCELSKKIGKIPVAKH